MDYWDDYYSFLRIKIAKMFVFLNQMIQKHFKASLQIHH